MNKLRVRYSKTGKAKYISHLDLMTLMQRALIRAGVNLQYSEGFNPHPYISVALPASVGVDSVCELMDVALSGGGSIGDDVNKFMPEGIFLQRAYKPWRKFSDIKWVGVEYKLSLGDKQRDNFTEAIEAYFSADSLPITKKTKRGTAVIDAAPHIKDIALSEADDGGLLLTAKLSAQSPTISHKDITNIIETVYSGFDNADSLYISAKRIEIYDASMVLFK